MGSSDKLDASVEALRDKLKGGMNDVETLVNLGGLYMYMQMFDEGDFLFRKALEVKPDSRGAAFGRALFHYNRGRVDEAEAALAALVEKHPDYAPPMQLLALIYSEDGRGEDAVAMLEKAIAAEPDNQELHYRLGNALDDIDDPERAMDCYRKAISIDESFAEAHNALGMLLMDEEDYDGAISNFRQALNIDPYYSNAHCNLAEAYVEHPDVPVQDAIDEFNYALKFNEGNDSALVGLGEIFFDDEHYRKALDYFERAVQANPESAIAYSSLGNTYLVLGEADEAVTAYRHALNLDSDQTEVHYWMAQALSKREEPMNTAINLKLYMEKEPDGDYIEEAQEQLEALKSDWPV